MQYYLAIKKEILPFVITWIELERIMLSEISHGEYVIWQILDISLIHGIQNYKIKKQKTKPKQILEMTVELGLPKG